MTNEQSIVEKIDHTCNLIMQAQEKYPQDGILEILDHLLKMRETLAPSPEKTSNIIEIQTSQDFDKLVNELFS